ncbi:GNAT family N-acetyltransferase [Bacillus sp. CLL-7-23]|uniref:GNAT family N-acetyltransferase n=1 Tax=Bacillus changyiensis TaxID=3004103 RepID=A0ABT4X707_9BACI|nr:GNAT family N-acetyltransferase [Bacillus changyiensis]MDA7027882.1 GNAT family N-acetyltransferase [Bacillus changyiensis]
MIHQLRQKSDFKLIRSLFHDKCHPILNGIIEGHHNGRIYVDHLSKPNCALVWAEQEIFYLLGDPQPDFVTELPTCIKEVIAPEAERINDHYFQVELWPESKWRQVVQNHLQMFLPKPYERVTFTFDPELYIKLSKKLIPSHVEVKRITLDMLSEQKFEKILESVVDFWESPDMFIKKGFGYVVIVEEKVRSSCLSVFATDSDVEIGIDTYNYFDRGKGYALLAARAFLDECLRQGRMPHWRTEDFRVSSIKLAEKVGFTNRQYYTAFVFLYNPLDHFVFSAYHQLRYGGNVTEANNYIKRAQVLGELDKRHHFLLSCGYSLAGRSDLSLKHLQLALDLGWNDISDIRYFVDLVHLRKTDKGRALLDEIENKNSFCNE